MILTDACPTGYQGAEMGISRKACGGGIRRGPGGMFAAKFAWFMGAGRVIVIDHLDYRLDLARRFAQAVTKTQLTQVATSSST